MATPDVSARRTPESSAADWESSRTRRTWHESETKLSLLTTEFWAMVGVIAGIFVAAAVSDTLGDVRAWTLVAAVAIGYMISRGLAKSGSHHRRSDDQFDRSSR